MSKLTVTIKQVKDSFEGSVSIPGLKTTKLARKDGNTLFPNSSAVKTVARSVGSRLGMEVEYAEPAKKAAKKSVKSKCSKSTCTKTPCCQDASTDTSN